MIKFVETDGGWKVQADKKTIGYILKSGKEFLLAPEIANRGFILLGPEDLREIAQKIEEAPLRKEHDVRRETVPNTNRTKLVCHSKECAGASIEMQPRTNPEKWAEEREAFLDKHFCRNIKT